MDDTVTTIVLLVLIAASSVNLLLTVRLAAVARGSAESPATPFSVAIGEALPGFKGRKLLGGEGVSTERLRGQPFVLVFLSGNCAACRNHVPELTVILEPARRAGVSLWIIDADGGDWVARLPDASPLMERMLVLDEGTRRRLNPRGAVPFYVFIDDEMAVQASNFLGDEDWMSFMGQMRDLDIEQPLKSAL